MDKRELIDRTREDLLKIAKSIDLPGRSKMKKEELVEAILREARRSAVEPPADARSRATRARASVVSRAEARKRGDRSETPADDVESALAASAPATSAPEPETVEEPPPPPPPPERKPARKEKASRGKAASKPPAPPRPPPPLLTEEKDRIVLLPRDPEWIFAYWDISDATRERLRTRIGEKEWSGGAFAVRLRAVDPGHGASLEIRVEGAARNWYIRLPEAGRTYRADLGFLSSSGRFVVLAGSNEVQTPPKALAPADVPMQEAPAVRKKEKKAKKEPAAYDWEVLADDEGAVAEAEAGRIWRTHVPGSGAFSGGMPVPVSGGLPSSPGARRGRPGEAGEEIEKGFWLRVGTELILYGATEPDAKVTVAGRPIRLRPDGTFTLRFALPDGVQELPVEATSADGDETRRITPVVIKETR